MFTRTISKAAMRFDAGLSLSMRTIAVERTSPTGFLMTRHSGDLDDRGES